MNGMDISKFNDEKMSRIRRQNIGFVFQFYNLIPNLNVAENIMLPLLLDGKKMRDYKKPLKDILEVVGLSDKRGHTPRELSGGQQQRVAIARALIGNPEILFADEPTGKASYATLVALLDKGVLYLPILFGLNMLFGLNGVIYTAPLTDMLSLLVGAALCAAWKRKIPAPELCQR